MRAALTQEEGLGLAKRNSELEAAARKLRGAARDSDAEHQRLLSRVQNLEVQLAREQNRYAKASQAAGEQVLQSLFCRLRSFVLQISFCRFCRTCFATLP